MMNRKVYVVWKNRDGGTSADSYWTTGPLNRTTVEQLVRDSLSYYSRDDFHMILSWQIEEEE